MVREVIPREERETVEQMQELVAGRLLAANGAVYDAFRNTACGLDPKALEQWFIESPLGQMLGDQAGKAFGGALSVAMMAVESERRLRDCGRWWTHV